MFMYLLHCFLRAPDAMISKPTGGGYPKAIGAISAATTRNSMPFCS